MKKLLYTIAAALAFTACTDDYTDWASPLTNAEEAAITVSGFTATSTAAIDLNSTDADSVQVFSLSTGSLPEGYTLQNIRMEITPNDVEGAETTTLSVPENGMMSASELQTLVQSVYGKSPTARTFTGHVYANAVSGTQSVLIDAGEVTITVTPEAPYISEHYYLIGAPANNELNENNGWSPTETSMPFSHSGQNVYDDPEFTITFPVSDGETWFAIIDDKTLESGEWSDVLGCAEGNGNNGTEGFIARRSELSDDGSWVIKVDGDAKFVRMTLNMMDYSYKLEKVNFGAYIYEIGNESGWATSHPLAGLNYDGSYTGFSYLNGEFKYKPNADNWEDDLEMVSGDCYEGTLTTEGGPNISAIPEGFYMMQVSLVEMTYKHTLISTIGVIGDATAGGWDSDQDMTFDSTDGSWNISGITLTDGTIKFRANDAWDINWGGDVNGLVANGDNIFVSAGTYDIKLIPVCDGMSTCTLTAK